MCGWISCMYTRDVFIEFTGQLGISCPCECFIVGDFPPINHSPFFIPGAGGSRTVTIEELKERTKVTDSQLNMELTCGIWQLNLTMWRPTPISWG